jgi:aldehyde dehydrogenase (NAD+)
VNVTSECKGNTMETTTAIVRDKLFIGGAWVPSSSDGSIDVIDSTTEAVMGSVPEGTTDDIDKAVAAAKQAFPSWSATPVKQRVELLSAVAGALGARMDALGELISHEVGMPLTLSKRIQVGLPMASFGSMEQVVSDFEFERKVGNSLIVREPVGVVGAITPWNYPLHQIAAKVAPALAAGCTVVLKPSEVAPLNAFVLAEIFEEIGLPAGVFNLVTGFGPVVGEALAGHRDVDMVSFTGSTRAGRRVSEVASTTIKRVALELGGKSANVLLEDADFEKAVPDGVAKCFLNSGQTCSALTRMLVPRGRLAEVEELATTAASSFTPGDPFDADTRLGPLVSAAQRDRVRHYIEKGVGEGADLLTGGASAPDGLGQGYFVQPTVFSSVTRDMTIAREEIFGPVLVIIPYDTEDEAVEIANDTDYGLAGGVWSGDQEHAEMVARRLRTGQVEVNGGGFNPSAPFGGYKQSGNGREFGAFGLEEFLEVKSMQL